MKRKIIAWLTAAAVVAGMMPGMAMPVFASGGTAVNGSDALAALGIDTSIAPDGFDENFARRNQRSINGPPRNDSIPYQLPLAVQHRKNKHLLFFMPQCFHIIFCDRSRVMKGNRFGNPRP